MDRMKKILVLAGSFLVLCSNNMKAQFDHPMKAFPSPQATGFGIFGDIPVNGFTGIPNISIPIYEFRNKNITLPISLAYHPGLVKPNLHPSWVGLGWNLLAGGCITRKVNMYPDEARNADYETGYLVHYNDLNSKDWYSPAKIDSYLKTVYKDDHHEMIPDEFSFNFCGYSGTFYLDHTGKWQVNSDPKIKVLFNKEIDCISIDQLRKNIFRNQSHYTASMINNRFINTFTLVTPDGIQYTFGGANATEYTIPYFCQPTGWLAATTWFLTKIKTPQGFEMSLKYEPDSPIFEIRPVYTYLSTYGHANGTKAAGSEQCRECLLIMPVYLSEITINSERSIKFKRSIRTDLKLRPSVQQSNTILNIDGPKDLAWENRSIFYIDEAYVTGHARDPFARGDISKFNWMQLDSIIIDDGNTHRKVCFYYNEGNSKRLKLHYFAEMGAKGELHKTHWFDYYKFGTGEWPGYFTDQEDHWGFYNNTSELPSSTFDRKQYPYHRIPSGQLEVRTSEVLSDITYPTGGKVHFVYEKNDYSKYIDTKENVLKSCYTASTAGIRIKEIIHKNSEKVITGIRRFYYLNDFDVSNNVISGTTSSGILVKEPRYFCNFDVTIGKTKYTYELFSSGTIGPYMSNVNGSHIGYSQVIEVNKKGDGTPIGYKVTRFSNYDNDNMWELHLDESPLYSKELCGYLLDPLSDKSMERGKILKEEYLYGDGTLRRAIHYFYGITPGQDYVRLLKSNRFFLGTFDKEKEYCNYMTAYKFFTHSYHLIRKEDQYFDKTYFSFINTISRYTYDEHKLLREEQHETGMSEKEITTYDYSYDIWDGGVYTNMKNRFIIKPIGKRVTLKKADGKEIFLQEELFKYNVENNLPYLHSYQKAVKKPLNFIEYYRCNKIDAKGNPLDITLRGNKNCVYLWSDDYQYPEVEIKNATYDQVKDLSRGSLRTALPQAQITFFDYTPDYKRTRETDVRGINTYYRYNSFGWLEQVLDHQSSVLQQYDYGFEY